MMEENRKGPGVFYAVMGVATLVVAIIGATFAFFSASATGGEDKIVGTAASGGNLSLEIAETSLDATGKLVPLKNETQMDSALKAAKTCVDTAGNTVCHVYSVKITNTGDTVVNVAGDMTLNVTLAEGQSGTSNMKWKVINAASGEGADDAEATPVDANTEGEIVALETLAAQTGTQTYYVVVWLEEQGTSQDTPDANSSYKGSVTFNAVNADGSASQGLTATFATVQQGN